MSRCAVYVVPWLATLLTVLSVPSMVVAAEVSDNAGTASAERTLTEDDLKALSWRSIGPANMGGRVAAIALAPGNPKTFFVGYATGGVWKTTNAGTTFKPVFDKYETSSIGSIVVCDAPPEWAGWDDGEAADSSGDADKPDDDRGKAKIVWVGTGESNGRNSSSWGHGVYRSTDGGGSFEHRGLEDTHDIPALAVDPRDPDTCYVAAMGHLWGFNDERGVYKTTDGGMTWNRVLHIDDKTGAIDVVLDPADPDTVYAAMYMRKRTAYSFQSGGPEGGIYRSRDGGDTWTKLMKGLPKQTGRIGLDTCGAKPNVLLAIVESQEGGWYGGTWSNRMREGGVFRSEDGGDTWERTTDFNPRAFYFSKIRVDPRNDQRVYVLGWGVYVSDDGGRTFRAGGARVPHVDFHAFVINPDDPDHLFAGNDGGLYVSHDRGKTWDFHNHMAVGQFYNVAVDHSDPYRVGGGLQDNGSWIGPSETNRNARGSGWGRAGGITNADWISIFGGDGFGVAFDPADENIVYAEWQGGNIGRIHLDTGERYTIRPAVKEGERNFRFNWNAPFFVSAHDPQTLYLGGNHVFKLAERGRRWRRISDDLSARDVDKIISAGSQAETHGTVVALAESPLQAGFLWAGTDDGLIHVTTDDGKTWSDVTPRTVGGLYVSKIEASNHELHTAYAAIDGHRSDAFDAILLMTEDGGATWASIASNLPDGAPVKVVREDPRSRNVLYVGTERAAWVSVDRGERWIKLNGKSLPTVAVDDLAIQAREMDLVAGTHGRSIWILDDIAVFSQLTDEVMQEPLHVFETAPAQPRYRMHYDGLWSNRMFVAKNPPMGAVITYWVRDYTGDDVKIAIKDRHGHTIRKLTGANRPGLNRIAWDLQAEPNQRLGWPHEMPEFVPAGAFKAEVSLGEHKDHVVITVLPAPGRN